MPSTFLDRNPSLAEDVALPVLIYSCDIDRGSFGDSGLPLPPPPGDTDHLSEPPLMSDSGGLALRRLVSRVVLQDELPSVIETIVSNMNATDIVKRLQGNDTQTFVDILDEVGYPAIPSMRNRFTDVPSGPPSLSFRH